MKSLFLVLVLVAIPALAEPHAWITDGDKPLPANPEQPSRGSFNRVSPPPVDQGRLDYYRGLQFIERERAHELRRARARATRIKVDVRQTVRQTVVIPRRGGHRKEAK